MAFGQPERNATDDANKGVVNPPALRESVRTSATKEKQISSLDIGVQKMGETLGNALVQKLDEKTTNINERRMADAVRRQHLDTAINEVDATSKRTGWTKFLFGENIEYRAAQQRAAQNAVTDNYLKQATEIDRYAGESPDDYKRRLDDSLDVVLKQYEGDADTTRMVAIEWMEYSGKLAAKQYESHYAWNQQQQRDTVSNQVQQTFDTFTVEAGNSTSLVETQGLLDKAARMFTRGGEIKPKGIPVAAWSGSLRPEGMTSEAYESVINEQLMNSLRRGNIGAYNAAKYNGWMEGLSVPEQRSMDEAVSAYDTDYAQQVAVLYESANLQAAKVETPEEALVFYDTLHHNLIELADRSSHTERADLALVRGHLQEQRGEALYEKALLAAAKKKAGNDQTDLLKAAFRERDPVTRAAIKNQAVTLGASNKDMGAALDLTLLEDVAVMAGLPEGGEITPAAFTEIVFGTGSTAIATHIADRVDGLVVKSPMVVQAVDTVISGFGTMGDEKGLLNDRGKSAFASMNILAQNEDTFVNMVGQTNYDMYMIAKRGFDRGFTVDQVSKFVDLYKTGDKDVGSNWPLPEDIDKNQYIGGIVKNAVGEFPTPSSLSGYRQDYEKALTMFDNDHTAAKDYVRTLAMNADTMYEGRAIVGGHRLNEAVEGYSFETLMDTAQATTGNSASMLTPKLMEMGLPSTDSEGNMVTNMNQVSGLEMYVVDGTDGVWMDSPLAIQPVHISQADLLAFGDLAKSISRRRLAFETAKNMDAWEATQIFYSDPANWETPTVYYPDGSPMHRETQAERDWLEQRKEPDAVKGSSLR